MGFLWIVIVYTSIILQTANGLPITNSEIYPHDETNLFNSINWESTSIYAAIPAVALVIAAFSFIVGCTWCYTHKDCKLFTASVSRIHDVARAPPPQEVSFEEPVNNNISEDNNNGPISFREMQNIANNNATAYIVSENEERNRAVSRESVVEFEPLPAALEVHVDPLERCRDWFAEEDFPRQRLQYLREIGRGWFGRIVIGEVDNGDSSGTVAVKILNQNASLEDKARFLDESKLYRDLRHDHLLTYIGRCLNEDPWIILYELCTMDLQEYLALNRPKMAILNEGGVPLRIACDVTSALAYLNSRGYVYGVVWSGSVSVRPEGGSPYVRGVLGAYPLTTPPDHLAPPDVTHTSMSDIWTVGAFLWELCSWSPAPLPPLAEPVLPCPYRPHLYQVMQLCWNSEPSLRPSAAQVHALVSHLESSHRSLRPPSDVSPEEFERRWTSLKPNHIPVVDEVARRSHSLTTLRGSLDDVSPAAAVASWLRDLNEDASYLRDVSHVINDLDNILNEENTSSEESIHQPSPARDHLNLDCRKAPPVPSGLVKSPGITDFQNILTAVEGDQHAADDNDTCDDDDVDKDTIGTLSHSFGRRDDSQNTLANLTPDTPNGDVDIFNQLEPPHTKLDNKDSETSNQIFDKQSINDAEMPNEFKHNISYNECPKLRELCLASIPRLSENEQINISEDCQTSCDIEKETVTDTHECIITKSVDNVVISQNHQDTVKDTEENNIGNENKDCPIALDTKELIQPSQNVIGSDTSRGEENHLVNNITSTQRSNTESHPVTEILTETPPHAKPIAEMDCNIVKIKCDTEFHKDNSVSDKNSSISNAEKNKQDSLLHLRQNCESFLNEIIAESVNIIENTQFDCPKSQLQDIKLGSQKYNDMHFEEIGKEAVISFKVVNEEVIPANQELSISNNHSSEHENDVKIENIIVQHEDGISFTESSPGKSRYEEPTEKSASESFNDSETPSTVPIDSKPDIVQKKLETVESSTTEEPKNRSDNTTNESTVYMDLINDTNTLNISKGKIIDDNIRNTIKTCVEKTKNQNSFIQVEFNNESTVYLDLPNVIEDTNKLLNSERGTTNFESDVTNITTSTPKVYESNDSNHEKPAPINAYENSCIKEFINDSDNISPLDSPTRSHPTDTCDENSSVLLGPFETNDQYKPITSEESSFPKEEVLAFSSNFSEINLATPSPLHDVNFLNEVPDLDSVTEFNFNDLKDTDDYDDHYVEIVDITDLDKPHVSPSTPPNSPGNFLASTSTKYLVDDIFVPDLQDAININQIDLQMTTKLAMAENENNMNIEYSGPLTVESIRENYVIPDIIIAGNGRLDDEDEPRVEFDDESMKAIRDELESKLPLAQISSIEPAEEAAGPMEVVLNYCGALSPIFEETAGQLERYENDIVSQALNTSKVNTTCSSESYFEPCDNSTDDITDLLTAANQTFTISSGDVPINITYSIDNKETHKNATVNKDSQNRFQLNKMSNRPSTSQSKAQDNVGAESALTPVDESTYNLMDKLSDCDRLSQVSPCLISPTTESSIPNSENATAFSTLCNTTVATDAKADTTKHDSTQLSKGTSIDSWCSNDTLFNVEDSFDDLAADDECKEQEPDESSRTLTDHDDDKDDSHGTPYIANDKSDSCGSMSSDSPTGHGTYTKLKADEATITASTPSEPNDSIKTTQTKDLAYGTLMSGVSCSNCTTEVISSLDWNLPQPELVRKSPCLDDTNNITQINLFDSNDEVPESPITSVEKHLKRIESVDQTFFTDNPTDCTSIVDEQEDKQAKHEKSPDFHLMNMAKSIQSTPLLHVVNDNDVEPVPLEPYVMPSNELNQEVDQSTNFKLFVNSAELRPQDVESLTTNKEFGQSINTDSLLEAIDSRVNHNIKDDYTALSPTNTHFKNLAENQPRDITPRPNGHTGDDFAAFERSIQNRPQNQTNIQDNIAILSNTSESPCEETQVMNYIAQGPYNLHSSTINKESGHSTNSDLLLEAEGSLNYNNKDSLSALSPVNESFESVQNTSSSKSNEVTVSHLEEFADFQNSIVNRPQEVFYNNECQQSSNILGNSSIEPKDKESSIKNEITNLSTSLEMVPQTSDASSNKDSLIVYEDFKISAVSQPQDVSSIDNNESSKSSELDCNHRPIITTPSVETLSDNHVYNDADSLHAAYLPFTGANIYLADNNIYDTEDAYDQPHSIIITEDVEKTFNSPENTNTLFTSNNTSISETNLQSPKDDTKVDDFTIKELKNSNDNSKITDKLTSNHTIIEEKKGRLNSQEQDQKEKQVALNVISGDFEELPVSINTESSSESNHTSIKENGIVNDTVSQITSSKNESEVTQNRDTSISRHVSTMTENFLKNEQQFNDMCLPPPMLNDIRFMGPGPEMLSTSFTDDSPTEETPKEKALAQNEHENQNGVVANIIREWDSGSDGSNSSSGEFIWKGGDGLQMILTSASYYQHNREAGERRESGREERRAGGERGGPAETEGDLVGDGGDGEDGGEGDEVEFVPSSWDCRAEPAKSSLRTLQRRHSKNKKRVVFKREKYHCVYEYPREVAIECDATSATTHYTTYADWDAASAEEAELAYGQLYGDHPLDLYSLRNGVYDYDYDFFISSSARPFESVGVMSTASQFFPGMKGAPPCTLELTTPDSGVEDILPQPWGGDSCSSSESVSPASELGGLRHTRDRLKLDLPASPLQPAPSPRSPRLARIFNFEQHNFGKTPPPAQEEQEETEDKVKEDEEQPATSAEVNIQEMKGEGTVLDSGDEDSGIESSSKASLDRNKQSPNLT